MTSRASPLVLRFGSLVGVSKDEMFRCAELDEADERPEGLTYDEGMRLWLACEALTEDSFVGLTAGTRVSLESMGMLGLAFATARDLADGLRVIDRTLPHLLQDADVGVRFDPSGGGLTYRMPDPRVRHGVDSMLAALLTLARRCVGDDLCAQEVDFQTAAPRGATRYREVFGVAPRFSAPICRLWFDAVDLARPFAGAEPATSALLLANASRLLSPPAAPTFSRQVEDAVLRSLEQGDGSLQGTAELLGVSLRTVQRHLAAIGVAFQDLRTRARRQLAEALLAQGTAVDEVARRVGYGGRSSFERAFREWTGETPARFRARGRDDQRLDN